MLPSITAGGRPESSDCDVGGGEGTCWTSGPGGIFNTKSMFILLVLAFRLGLIIEFGIVVMIWIVVVIGIVVVVGIVVVIEGRIVEGGNVVRIGIEGGIVAVGVAGIEGGIVDEVWVGIVWVLWLHCLLILLLGADDYRWALWVVVGYYSVVSDCR